MLLLSTLKGTKILYSKNIYVCSTKLKWNISNQRHHLRLDVKELFTKTFETPAVQMGAQCSPIPMTSAMLVPWSKRFFLIFLRERDQEEAAKRRQRVAKATRRERKTSGYLGLESHFHADDSCQTRQIANKKSDQWQLSKHVLISRYFFKWG